MKNVQGLITLTVAACLVSMATSRPLFLGPVTGATLTLADGLILTGAAGTLLELTTPQLILGGLAAKALALQGLVLASSAQDRKQTQTRRRIP